MEKMRTFKVDGIRTETAAFQKLKKLRMIPVDPAFSSGGRQYFKSMQLLIGLKFDLNRINFQICNKSSIKSIFKN